jgi:dTMP kinase
MDEQSIEFHRKVRNAYHQLAEDEPQRVRLIDGSRPETDVAHDVWAAVEARLAQEKPRSRK